MNQFDFASLTDPTATTSQVVLAYHPHPEGGTKKGEPIGFTVLGSNSAEYEGVLREIEILNVKELGELRKKGDGEIDAKAPEFDTATDVGATRAVDNGARHRHMIAMACVVDWFGWRDNGADLPFSREKLAVLLKARPQYARRIVAAVEGDANFTSG